jgi:hypothetical protein
MDVERRTGCDQSEQITFGGRSFGLVPARKPAPASYPRCELSVEEQRGGGDCRPACLRIIYGYRDVVRIRVNGASILQHKERLFFGLKEPNFGALLIDGLANRPQPGMSLARRSFSALRSVTKGMVKAERP